LSDVSVALRHSHSGGRTPVFAHEEAHVAAADSESTFQAANAASAAGDAPSVPGSTDTVGGTAERKAQSVVSSLGNAANSFVPNEATDKEADAIINEGLQKEGDATATELQRHFDDMAAGIE
jgi:hypothetical protein